MTVKKIYALLIFTLTVLTLSIAISVWRIYEESPYWLNVVLLLLGLVQAVWVVHYWLKGDRKLKNAQPSQILRHQSAKLRLSAYLSCYMYLTAILLLVLNGSLWANRHLNLSEEPTRVQSGIPFIISLSVLGFPLILFALRKSLTYEIVKEAVYVYYSEEVQRFSISRLEGGVVKYSMGYLVIDGSRCLRGSDSWTKGEVAFPVSGWAKD